MHAPVPPANQIHSEVRFDAPRLSENRSVNVLPLPLPDDGLTLNALTPGGTDEVDVVVVVVEVGVEVDVEDVGTLVGTVHTPRYCQPLDCSPAAFANILTVFAPANADLKVNASFSVSTEPLTEAELLAGAIEHEPFCSVVPRPSVWEAQAEPASFIR
jgi:hypothetical protein